MKILIVDDEIHLFKYIITKLNNSYSIDIASNAKKGLYLAKHNTYQAIILDIFLPDLSGIELCKQIREKGVLSPIIMLTANDSISQKTLAFNFGADDYITKPFSLEELHLRIQSLQRRSQYNPSSNYLRKGNFSIDCANRILIYKEKEIRLSRKEFDIFELLFKQINFTVSRDKIANHLWSHSVIISSNSIDVHIGNLRKKLNNTTNEINIKSVNGIGYVLIINTSIQDERN